MSRSIIFFQPNYFCFFINLIKFKKIFNFSAPPTINDDPTSGELASKTGIVTTFSGPSNPMGAAWGDVRYLGITADAFYLQLTVTIYFE